MNALDEDFKSQRALLKKEKKYAVEVIKKNANKLDLKVQGEMQFILDPKTGFLSTN